MPRPYPATPRVAHNPEAMPRFLAYLTLREREVAATAAAAGLSGLRSL